MDTESIRAEMLKVHEHCSVGIMTERGKVHLVWNAGNEMHPETLLTDDCVIGSDKFKDALERATESLIH